ncbi:WD40-repeat-containing domain protein [Chytriomyces sp. MP71]|nr:WD40-repeat-containing domain protein [Chytriomyces sp. MP71]
MDTSKETGYCLGSYRFHDGTVYSLEVFYADKDVIAMNTGFRPSVQRRNAKSVQPEENERGPVHKMVLVTGSHDTEIAVSTVQKGYKKEMGIHVNASKVFSLNGHSADVYAIEVLPEADSSSGSMRLGHIISAGDYTVRAWDLEKRVATSIFSGHTGFIACIKVRGKRAFSGSWDTTIRSWNLETGKPMHVFKGHNNIVNCIDVTNADLFSGSWDQTIIRWSRATGEPVISYRGHTDGVQCLQVYEGLLISGSMDKTVRVWDIPSGRTLRVMKGHTAGIECLHIAQDVCFTGSYDKTARCFNLDTGECLMIFEGHTDGIYCIKFFEGLLFTGSGDKSVRIWDANFVVRKRQQRLGFCCLQDSTK